MAYLVDEELLEAPEGDEPLGLAPLLLDPDCAGSVLLGVAPVPGFSKHSFGIAVRDAYFVSSHFGSFFASCLLVSGAAELVVEFTEDGVLAGVL
jgi:hypothetical protein